MPLCRCELFPSSSNTVQFHVPFCISLSLARPCVYLPSRSLSMLLSPCLSLCLSLSLSPSLSLSVSLCLPLCLSLSVSLCLSLSLSLSLSVSLSLCPSLSLFLSLSLSLSPRYPGLVLSCCFLGLLLDVSRCLILGVSSWVSPFVCLFLGPLIY